MGNAVRNIQDVKNIQKRDIDVSAIILADRAGYRMRSYGPLSIYNLTHNKNLLFYQIKSIKRNLKIKEIILIIGFQADKIIKKVPHNLTIIENKDFEHNNVLASMNIGLNAATTTRLLFVDGNTLISSKTFCNFQPRKSQIYLNRKMVKLDNNRQDIISSIVNNKDEIESSSFMNTINSWQNIFFITGRELQLLRIFSNDVDKQKWYSFEATNKITDMGGKFLAYHTNNVIINIDSHENLKKATNYAYSNI